MNTCKTCKYWEGESDVNDHKECANKKIYKYIYLGYHDNLEVHRDFGCVLHEQK